MRSSRCRLDDEKPGQMLVFVARWRNTSDRDATMHPAPEVRDAYQAPEIGYHWWCRARRVPSWRCFLVCDIQCINASVHGWPWASISVTQSSTFNSLTQYVALTPKELGFGGRLTGNLLLIDRLTHDVDAPTGQFCCKSSILPFFANS